MVYLLELSKLTPPTVWAAFSVTVEAPVMIEPKLVTASMALGAPLAGQFPPGDQFPPPATFHAEGTETERSSTLEIARRPAVPSALYPISKRSGVALL